MFNDYSFSETKWLHQSLNKLKEVQRKYLLGFTDTTRSPGAWHTATSQAESKVQHALAAHPSKANTLYVSPTKYENCVYRVCLLVDDGIIITSANILIIIVYTKPSFQGVNITTSE